VKTEEKSNRICAVPKLLEVLHLQAASSRWMQREVAEGIVERSAHHIFSHKGNQ
jgi:predicted transposase YbfD/YdcC